MIDVLDSQGFKVEVGNAYQWVFAMPGPDVTLLKILNVNGDNDILAYDLIFKFELTVKAKDLFRPVNGGWSKYDADKISQCGASLGGVKLK